MNKQQLIAEMYWVGILSAVAGWAAVLIVNKTVFKNKKGLEGFV